MTWRVTFFTGEILLEFCSEKTSPLPEVMISIGPDEMSYALLREGQYVPGAHDFQAEFAAASAEVVAATNPPQERQPETSDWDLTREPTK